MAETLLSKNIPDPDFGNEILTRLRRNPSAHFIIDVKLVQANKEIRETMHPVTQITVATVNRPKLFNKVLNAIAIMRLDIKETYAYRTTDGYVLSVFIHSGHEYKAEHLNKALEKELRKSEISEGTELPQESPTVCFLGMSWTCVRCLFYMIVSLAALYFLIDGIFLMYGAPKEADVLGFAAPIGKVLIGNATEIANTDIGASLVFVAVPLLGVVTVLFMLLAAIRTSMVMKAKVPIVSWLTVSLFLGIALPFMKVGVAAIKDDASSVFSSLVTVLAALTNFHRKDD